MNEDATEMIDKTSSTKELIFKPKGKKKERSIIVTELSCSCCETLSKEITKLKVLDSVVFIYELYIIKKKTIKKRITIDKKSNKKKKTQQIEKVGRVDLFEQVLHDLIFLSLKEANEAYLQLYKIDKKED